MRDLRKRPEGLADQFALDAIHRLPGLPAIPCAGPRRRDTQPKAWELAIPEFDAATRRRFHAVNRSLRQSDCWHFLYSDRRLLPDGETSRPKKIKFLDVP